MKPDAQFSEAVRLAGNGELDAAESLCRAGLDANAQDVNMLGLLGAILLKGGRVDEANLDALLAERGQILRQFREVGLNKQRRFRFAHVPPLGKAALGVAIDQGDRSFPGEIGLDRDMTTQGCFPRSALLRGENDCPREVSL